MVSKKPDWLKVKFHRNESYDEVEKILSSLSLHTVCEEASCPNRMECFSRKTATFMILGKICTRNCTFCDVAKGNVESPDAEEPFHVASAVKALDLKYVVITSVTRDDLSDGGAGHFHNTIREIKKLDGDVIIEVLIPDFKGNSESLSAVVSAEPGVINHNIETVPRLYPAVRPMAVYERSLELLRNSKNMNRDLLTKSGIMLGLGEEEHEIIETMKDLRSAGCDLLTIGQYLSPSKNHHPVIEYVHPDIFKKYGEIGMEMGFKHVASSPLVRSSFHADKASKWIVK